MATFRDLQKAYPEFETYDDDEEDRVENVQMYAVDLCSLGKSKRIWLVAKIGREYEADVPSTVPSPVARVPRRRRGPLQVRERSFMLA